MGNSRSNVSVGCGGGDLVPDCIQLHLIRVHSSRDRRHICDTACDKMVARSTQDLLPRVSTSASVLQQATQTNGRYMLRSRYIHDDM